MAILSAQDWTLAALHTLAQHGIASVRVEALARELGVTKGSFYHHFARRDELLEAMLALWRQLATERVIQDTDATSDDPHARLHELTRQVFADEGDHPYLDSAIREWASSSQAVAQAVTQIDTRRLAYVERLLRAAGIPAPVAARRAEIFYRTMLGEFAWRRYGGPCLTREAQRDLAALMLESPRPTSDGPA